MAYRYQAFISYRHADNKQEGRQWATWLHQALETYDVPSDLVGTINERGDEIPARIYPVFRDEEELPADADLGGAITRALDETSLLIVLCSPRAVESSYVADEIDYFKRLGRSDRIIAALIDGEPNTSLDPGKIDSGFHVADECFPRPLQFDYDDKGPTDKRAEPIAADFRLSENGRPSEGWTNPEAYRRTLKDKGLPAKEISAKVSTYEKQVNLMLLKIIAGILGVALGTLTKRDQEYQLQRAQEKAKKLRRWLMAVAVLAVAALTAGGFAYLQKQEAERQQQIAVKQKDIATTERAKAVAEKDKALISQSRFLLDAAAKSNKDRDYDKALLIGLNAIPGLYGGDRPVVNFTADLRTALLMNSKIGTLKVKRRFALSSDPVATHPKKSFLSHYEDGKIKTLDYSTGAPVAALPFKSAGTPFLSYSQDGKKLIAIDGQTVSVLSADQPDSIKESFTFEETNIQRYSNWHLSHNGDFITASGYKMPTVIFHKEKKYLTIPEPVTPKHMADQKLENTISKVIFSPDNDHFLVQMTDSSIQLWSLKQKKAILSIPAPKDNYVDRSSRDQFRLPKFSTDGKLFFQFDTEGTQIWDTKTLKVINTIQKVHVAFSPDGQKYLILPPLSSGQTGAYLQADLDRATKPLLIRRLKDNKSFQANLPSIFKIFDANFSPNSDYLITQSEYGSLTVWHVDSATKVQEFKGGRSDSFQFSADGNSLLQFSLDGTINIYSLNTRWQRRYFNATHILYYTRLRLSQSGWLQVKLAGEQKGSARLVNLSSGAHIDYPHTCPIDNFQESPKGDYFYEFCKEQERLTLRPSSAPEQATEIPIADIYYAQNSISLSDTAHKAAYVNWDRNLVIIDLKTGEKAAPIDLHKIRPQSFVFSSDGTQVFIREKEKLYTVSLATKKVTLLYDKTPKGKLIPVPNHPDKLVIHTTVNNRSSLHIIDITAPDAQRRYDFTTEVKNITFSQDGKKILLSLKGALIEDTQQADDNKAPQFIHAYQLAHDQATAIKRLVIKQKANYTYRATFSPDGRFFSLGNVIHSMDSHLPVLTFYDALASNQTVFTKDSSAVYLVTTSGAISYIPLDTKDLYQKALQQIPFGRHCLTEAERDALFLAPLTESEKKTRGCLAR